MFPGITVLTRDLNDIMAMYKLIQSKKSKNLLDVGKFKSKDNDKDIVQVLKADLGKDKKYDQVMSFWQRYGSLVSYFQFFNSTESLSYKRMKTIIFENVRVKAGEPNDLLDEKKKRVRPIRIDNANWYRSFRKKLQIEITSNHVPSILKSRSLYWWITGMELQKGDGVPDIIAYSRKLEFALTVWQTALESSAFLVKRNQPVPTKGTVRTDAVENFLVNILLWNSDQKSDDVLFKLAQASLDVHETHFRDGSFQVWEENFKKWLDKYFPHEKIGRFITFHDGRKTVTKLASEPSSGLLESLTQIHCIYCVRQKKENSIYIHSFKDRKLGKKFPEISAYYSPFRWGLFGYRLEASVSLYNSQKYVD